MISTYAFSYSHRVLCNPVMFFFVFLFAETNGMPRFVGPVTNVTVPVGREAIITCTVENLGSFKVTAWNKSLRKCLIDMVKGMGCNGERRWILRYLSS